MPALKQLQQQFFEYLLSSTTEVGQYIVDQGKLDRFSRLDIYKNAYQVRLTKCIETDHEMLGLYLGDDLFDKMAQEYIAQYPSNFTSLRYFCDHIPDYLSQNEPFKSVPILSEIAQFERCMLSAFDAAETEQRACMDDLQNLPSEQWPELKILFHPSVRLFESKWNSVESWQALKNQQSPPQAMESNNYWLVWRGEDRLTQFRHLSNEAYIMYNCFKDQYDFSVVCELLLEHLPEEQIAPATVETLNSWLQQGLIYRLITD